MKKPTAFFGTLITYLLLFVKTTPVLADLIDIDPEPTKTSSAKFLIPLLIIAIVILVAVLFLRSRKNK